MKKVIFSLCILLGAHALFGTMVEKDGVSIKYEEFRKIKEDYKNPQLGWPYRITITNHSDVPIMVDKSLIKTPLYSPNEAAKAIRFAWKTVMALGTINTPMLTVVSYLLFKDMKSDPTFKSPTLYPFSLGTKEGKTPFIK